MNQILKEILIKAKEDIESLKDVNVFNDLKAKYLGKKSELNGLMTQLKDKSIDEKKQFGKELNELKEEVSRLLETKKQALENKILEEKINKEKIDITMEGHDSFCGSKHLINRVIDEVDEIFLSMGYSVSEGPVVELDHYNFELLNIPHDHPAREMQDSFFIDDKTLLRSHTSPVQAHVLEAAKGVGPIKVICPGKVFRRDDDATHSHQFGQIEGLVIDKDVNLGTLYKTLEILLKSLFGEDRELRFRPSYFPFTEPSVEVDVSCFNCGGKGCSLCKQSGWIEVLGAGMVHPNVLRMSGFDPNVYQGFAFGMGIERIAMLKYRVDDIRKFYTNDVRFNAQFDKEGK